MKLLGHSGKVIIIEDDKMPIISRRNVVKADDQAPIQTLSNSDSYSEYEII